MTFLSYKRVFVAIALVLSGFVAFGSTGVQGQNTGLDLGSGLSATIGDADQGICSLSTSLSQSEVNSVLGITGETIVPNNKSIKSGSKLTNTFTEATESGGSDKLSKKISSAEWSGLCGYSLAKVIINWISIIVGVVALLFILFAAFLYIQGRDSGATNTKARNTLIAAIVGSVVAILAQVILRVIRGFFG